MKIDQSNSTSLVAIPAAPTTDAETVAAWAATSMLTPKQLASLATAAVECTSTDVVAAIKLVLPLRLREVNVAAFEVAVDAILAQAAAASAAAPVTGGHGAPLDTPAATTTTTVATSSTTAGTTTDAINITTTTDATATNAPPATAAAAATTPTASTKAAAAAAAELVQPPPVQPPRPIVREAIVLCIDVSGSMQTPFECDDDVRTPDRTRLESVKQMFYGFRDQTTNYCEAQSSTTASALGSTPTVQHLLGLVSYDSEVEVHTLPTADYDVFEDVIDDMKTKGMTAIYAAIARACKMLAPVGQAHPEADLRVIVLTDGQNNCNDVDAAAAVLELAEIGATCDCLLVGNRTDADLSKLVAATEGECFTLEGLSDAYEVFESRAFVSLAERRGGAPKPSLAAFRSKIPKSLSTVKAKAPKKGALQAPAAAAAGHAGGYAGATRFAPLSDLVADGSIAKLSTVGGAVSKRLRKELAGIGASTTSRSNGNVFYFPGVRDDSSIKEIKMLIAPDAEPYAGRVFEALLTVPEAYPFSPPSLRIVTPIYHYAVSTGGAICLDLLKSSWSPSQTIETLMNAVYDLIVVPTKVDPSSELAVRSWLSEQLRVNTADYYAEAKKQAEVHAKAAPVVSAGEVLSAGLLEKLL